MKRAHNKRWCRRRSIESGHRAPWFVSGGWFRERPVPALFDSPKHNARRSVSHPYLPLRSSI